MILVTCVLNQKGFLSGFLREVFNVNSHKWSPTRVSHSVCLGWDPTVYF